MLNVRDPFGSNCPRFALKMSLGVLISDPPFPCFTPSPHPAFYPPFAFYPRLPTSPDLPLVFIPYFKPLSSPLFPFILLLISNLQPVYIGLFNFLSHSLPPLLRALLSVPVHPPPSLPLCPPPLPLSSCLPPHPSACPPRLAPYSPISPLNLAPFFLCTFYPPFSYLLIPFPLPPLPFRPFLSAFPLIVSPLHHGSPALPFLTSRPTPPQSDGGPSLFLSPSPSLFFLFLFKNHAAHRCIANDRLFPPDHLELNAPSRRCAD